MITDVKEVAVFLADDTEEDVDDLRSAWSPVTASPPSSRIPRGVRKAESNSEKFPCIYPLGCRPICPGVVAGLCGVEAAASWCPLGVVNAPSTRTDTLTDPLPSLPFLGLEALGLKRDTKSGRFSSGRGVAGTQSRGGSRWARCEVCSALISDIWACELAQLLANVPSLCCGAGGLSGDTVPWAVRAVNSEEQKMSWRLVQ
mmetsp:Transcript_9994/g.24159  ORF Transcript_9994/g.24159 Transcript_9994/m.24159 type:complete len:201 (-) Transcript_9994:99-701(-)